MTKQRLASFDEALAAYKRGEYEEAFEGFRAIAAENTTELWLAQAIAHGRYLERHSGLLVRHIENSLLWMHRDDGI